MFCYFQLYHWAGKWGEGLAEVKMATRLTVLTDFQPFSWTSVSIIVISFWLISRVPKKLTLTVIIMLFIAFMEGHIFVFPYNAIITHILYFDFSLYLFIFIICFSVYIFFKICFSLGSVSQHIVQHKFLWCVGWFISCI